MNHHRTRQFLREMAPPRPLRSDETQRPFATPLARDLFALGAEAMIAQAKAADLDRNVRAAISDEEGTEGKPFPQSRINPHD